MMVLQLLWADGTGNDVLVGSVSNIEQDYLAEKWVRDVVVDELNDTICNGWLCARFNKIVLHDNGGVRAIWRVCENHDVRLDEKSGSFTVPPDEVFRPHLDRKPFFTQAEKRFNIKFFVDRPRSKPKKWRSIDDT